MLISDLEHVARNVPRIPRWPDEDVVKKFLQFVREASTVSEIYNGLRILRSFRPIVFSRIYQYIRRRYADDCTFLNQFEQCLKDARTRTHDVH